MALIACPECKGRVSTAAFSCPHCGFPLDSREFDVEPYPANSEPASARSTPPVDPVSRTKEEWLQFQREFEDLEVSLMKTTFERQKDLLVTVFGEKDYRALLSCANELEYQRRLILTATAAGKDTTGLERGFEQNSGTVRRLIAARNYRC
jgi:hypothetical protein